MRGMRQLQRPLGMWTAQERQQDGHEIRREKSGEEGRSKEDEHHRLRANLELEKTVEGREQKQQPWLRKRTENVWERRKQETERRADCWRRRMEEEVEQEEEKKACDRN